MAAYLDDGRADLAAQVTGLPIECLAGLGVAGTHFAAQLVECLADLAAEIRGALGEGVTKLVVHGSSLGRVPVPCQRRRLDTVPAPSVH